MEAKIANFAPKLILLEYSGIIQILIDHFSHSAWIMGKYNFELQVCTK